MANRGIKTANKEFPVGCRIPKKSVVVEKPLSISEKKFYQDLKGEEIWTDILFSNVETFLENDWYSISDMKKDVENIMIE